MNVAFYTPLADQPEVACGAIVDCEDEARNLMEYIPFPLFPEHMDTIVERGIEWLIGQIPLDFPVFLTQHEASGFLHEMALQVAGGGMPHPKVVEVLIAKYRGEWRDKAEYGYEVWNS